MTSLTFTHSEFLQRVDVYVAGGLIDDEVERLAFEAHAAGCPTCAAALAAAREHDMTMINLFGDVRPGDGFEDRLLGALRNAAAAGPGPSVSAATSLGRRAIVHPFVRRAAVGVAAAVLLGGVGLVAERAFTGDTPRGLQALHLPGFLGGAPRKAAPAGGEGGQAPSPATQPATAPSDSADWYVRPAGDRNLDHFYTDMDVNGVVDHKDVAALGFEVKGLQAANGRGRGGDVREETRSSGRFAVTQFRGDAASPLLGVTDGEKAGAADRSYTQPQDGQAAGPSSRSDLRRESTVNAAGAPDGSSSSLGAGTGVGSGSGVGGGAGGGGGGFGGRFGNAPGSGPAPGNQLAGAEDFIKADVEGRKNLETNRGLVVTSGGTVANPTGVVDGVTTAVPQLQQNGQASAEAQKQLYTFRSTVAKPDAPAGGGEALERSKSVDLYFKLDKAEGRALNEADPSLDAVKLGRASRDYGMVTAGAADKGVKDGPGGDRFWDRSGWKDGGEKDVKVLSDQLATANETREKAKGEGSAETPTAGKPIEVAQNVEGKPAPTPTTLGDLTVPAVAEPRPAPTPPPPVQQMQRKIIRNGDVTFEVDGFDSSLLQITKIAAEEGGFVATTDSEKLPNGKVKGTVTVRVPPDRLDTLVLKLRGLGDLKSSRLAANDVTKLYTDMNSQLTAAQAMYDRLLGIIKDGKGAVKDLLEAEKQLGVWREKLEKLKGELLYYDNLVSLSTLNVTLYERDIRTSGLLTETETVDMGVETDDVEKARADAIKAIEGAKGRIINSDLKRHDAGQYVAKIDADVTPEQAGAVIDRLKQLGRVGRLDVQRRQTTAEGTPPIPGAKVERKDTRLTVSIYNLANIAPRVSTTLNLAAEDVEVAYRAVLDQVKSSGGRVVTSQLNRPRPDQTTGTITFETPNEVADVLLGAVRGAGEVMRLDVTQNPDTQNTTDAKRGFAVQIFSLASVAPRETTSLQIATRSVPDTFAKVRDAVRAASSRVLTTQLNEGDPNNVSGQLDFEVKRADWPAVDAALRDAGLIVSRQVARSADTENTVDTKIRMQVTFVDEVRLAPAETVTLQLAVSDVPTQYARILDAVRGADARVLDSRLDQAAERNNVTGTLVIDVRRGSVSAVNEALSKAGDVVSRNFTRATTPQPVQDPKDEKVRLSLTIGDADLLQPRETTSLDLEVEDVDRAVNDVRDKAIALGGRLVDFALKKERNGRVIGRAVVDVPLAKSMEMVVSARDQGKMHARRDTRNEQVPDGTLARARVDVQLMNVDPIVSGDKTLGSSVRSGLSSSMDVLLGSVRVIVFGLCVILPWVLVIWLVARWYGRMRRRRAATTTGGTTPPPPTIVPPAPA